MTSQRRRPAGFFRQALWIAMPVAILSAVALYSLRQDRAGIAQDARDRAQVLVSSLADQWRGRVARGLENFLVDWYFAKYVPVALAWPKGSGIVRVDNYPDIAARVKKAQSSPLMASLPQMRGRLLDGRVDTPVDYPQLPIPPDWIARLTSEQMRAMQFAEQSVFQQRDAAAGSRALSALKAARVPEAAYAAAECDVLRIGSDPVPPAGLGQRLIDLARKYPEATTASGSPVADLALLRALHLAKNGPHAEALNQELFHRAIGYPSFLTPALIAAAEGTAGDARNPESVRVLKDVWLQQEKARELLRLLLKIPPDPSGRLTEIWLEAEDQPFLALRETKVIGHDYAVVLIPGRVLEQAFLNAFAETRSQLPSYMDVSVQVGQRHWPVIPDGLTLRHGSKSLNVLASAATGLSARPDLEPIPGSPREGELLYYLAPPESLAIKFTVNLELGRPELLYARYRQRLWLAVGLVLSATAAAGAGLAGAWRAFRRQERLAEMTSNFVSSVSHELRAPLASVRLMAERLDQGRIENAEKQKEYFRLIGQECSRLSSLVENVLDFSRIHQGRKRYEFEPIDLVALIRQTVRLMDPGAGARDVNLLLSELPAGCEGLQPCWDGQAVQQALVNLIDNAIKHSPAGSQVMVACETAGEVKDAMIRVSVSDQGQGIPIEERERIFEPFYRSGVELRRETRGIGIGLSIVKHVAEAHGGRVILESSMGQGSRFTLELPAASRSEKAGGESSGH